MKESRFYFRRVASAIVDGCLFLLVFYIAWWVLPHEDRIEELFCIFLISLVFTKDLYGGVSLGKRLFGIQVVYRGDHEGASSLQCFIRNLTLIIFPIEIIWLLVSPHRRLGDYIASTEVVNYQGVKSMSAINKFGELLLPLFFGFFICFGISFLFIEPANDELSVCHFPEESSLNVEASECLCHIFVDDCFYVRSAEIEVYDSTYNDTVPFVKAVLYLDNAHPSMTRLAQRIEKTVAEQLKKEYFIVYCEYIVTGLQEYTYTDTYIDNRYK